jgi:hypothetical protein
MQRIFFFVNFCKHYNQIKYMERYKWSAHGVLEQCLVYYICVQPCITIFISYSHNKSYNDLLLFVYLSMILQRFYSLILPKPSHINICENGQCSHVLFWLPQLENRGSQNTSEQSRDCLLFHAISVPKIRSTPSSKWMQLAGQPYTLKVVR